MTERFAVGYRPVFRGLLILGELASLALFVGLGLLWDIPFDLFVFGGLAVLGGVAWSLWMMLGVRYELDDQGLVTHTGPFQTRTNWADIKAVHAKRDKRSWTDGLELHRADGSAILVVPDSREDFISAVRARAPHINVQL